MRIFKEAVHQDHELAPDGGEGEFGGLAVFAPPLIEGFENWVVHRRGQSGHVENPADGGADTADMALAAALAAVVIERGDAGDVGGLIVAERAEFR